MARSPALRGQAVQAERLDALFRCYHEAVARYVARRAPAAVVEDVVAETFLVAWRRIDDVPDDPLPWLLGVARRTLATQRRAAGRRSALTKRLAEVASPPAAAAADLDGAIGAALARLRPLDREALTLVAWDGLTPAQAAAALGHSRVGFRVRLHRARQRLRGELERVTPQPTPLAAQVLEDESLRRAP
jgi:RNA polymerase sigma-70 factor (ECF subfamily)